MTPIYLTATRLREFGADRLAEHLLCTLRETPGFRGRPSVLDENLAAIRTESDLRQRVADSIAVASFDGIPQPLAVINDRYLQGGPETELLDGWREETLRRLGDAPYRTGSPTLQLPFAARTAVEVVALVLGARRKLAGQTPEPELIEAPVPPVDAISFGHGGGPVIIVGDPQDGALPGMLEHAAALLGLESERQVRWIWMHAPRTETPQTVWQALQREKQLNRLAGAPIHLVAAALREPLPAAPPLAFYPDDSPTKAVFQQLSILDACGVPRSRRPALIVGRSLYLESLDASFVEELTTPPQ